MSSHIYIILHPYSGRATKIQKLVGTWFVFQESLHLKTKLHRYESKILHRSGRYNNSPRHIMRTRRSPERHKEESRRTKTHNRAHHRAVLPAGLRPQQRRDEVSRHQTGYRRLHSNLVRPMPKHSTDTRRAGKRI